MCHRMQSNKETCKLGAGYGLEIPVQYRFIGAEKAVERTEKNIKNIFKNINKKMKVFVK